MRRRAFLRNSAIGVATFAFTEGLESGGRSQASGAFVGDEVVTEEERRLAWGVNALVLKTPWTSGPSLDDLLSDAEHTVALSRFFRAGGQNGPVTSTECRLAYSSRALFVVFRCEENNLSYPYANLDPKYWSSANWYALHGLPSGTDNWPPYPDEVDILIQPDTATSSYYQFAVTLQGMKFGCERLLSSNMEASPDEAAAARHSSIIPTTKVEAFEASVSKGTDEWMIFFQIPWETLGGKPKSHFGLLPMRTRWRDGQFISPVAIGFGEGMPVDLLIETHFSDKGRVENSESSLCRLPSGILRWQRPAVLNYPDSEIPEQIWRMESLLSTPTHANNLAQRLFLAQRWMDLMTLEGFTPLPRAWGISKHNLTLTVFRQRMNAAFQENNPGQAYQLLDSYLSRLDKMSRWWYADGSPGDILKQEWKPVTSADSLEVQGKTLLMRCRAGGHEVDLHIALPQTGGIRIYGSEEGYWRPADLSPLKATQSSGSCAVETAEGRIIIRQRPFSISFYNPAGNEVTQIGAGALAFRLGSDGKILAVDFKNRLDPGEVIYGFGEKYDDFNEDGHVLTLWGTDDWLGNGEGLANTTYKPLPVFHSTKGYMLFDNSSYRLRADIGKRHPNQYRLTQQGPIFDYYFWIGSPREALSSYTALTGRVPLPPKWVFEPWMGRGGDAWASGPLHSAVAEEESVALRFAELDIPHSAIYAEGPSAISPDLNEFMAARGIRVLGYFYPVINPQRQRRLMPHLNPDELPILDCGTENLTRELGYVDFTNPNALDLCRRALRRALELGEAGSIEDFGDVVEEESGQLPFASGGAAGSMVDFGDMVPDSAVFYDGQHGAEMHNFYYYQYQRTVSEVFREKRGDDFILFARGAAPGTQAWVAQFAGDHPSNFVGIKHVLTGALNLCACSYSTWGSDLGGYFGFPQPAVYMRWFQLGCFSPLMRPHGVAPRDPWHYGEAAVVNYKFLAWTRENILNYTYNAAVVAHETGIPIMRSMAVEFPDERPLAAVWDQYMFGPDLLVAPVTNEETFRTILFPSGVWTSLWNGKTVLGPAKRKVTAPLDTIPVYLRPGSLMPVELNQQLHFGESMTGGRVHVLVVTPPNENESISLLNAQGGAAKVTVQSKAGGFAWRLENLPEMNYVLVYGTTAASTVKVNGTVWPRLTATAFSSMAAGWQADVPGNRLVIRLPGRQVEQSELTTEIEVNVSGAARQVGEKSSALLRMP
jgi:alpha-glucosidase (family GH31 glycosyl hydrolase)